MSTYFRAFLEVEITVIPQIMDGYIGKYYNNALYNGITWMVFILHIIHFLFDFGSDALLKKMRFKEYARIRLRKSVWYLGFYACSFVYCTATLWKNNIKFPQRHKFQILNLMQPISGHLILGYVLLTSFYTSSAMWEGLQCSITSFTYLFLTGFVAFAYFFRYIELAVLLASTFSAVHMLAELARCLFCIVKGDLLLQRFLIKIIFYITILAFTITYFVIIPITFLLPIGYGLLRNHNSIIMMGLNVSLWGWYLCEIYDSPLYRMGVHRWQHGVNEKVPECLGSRIECALFKPRDDVAYNMKVIKQEIKERQARLLALRKPKKSASVLMQTLKCVVAINRKMKNKRLMEQSLRSSSDNCISSGSQDIVKCSEELLPLVESDDTSMINMLHNECENLTRFGKGNVQDIEQDDTKDNDNEK